MGTLWLLLHYIWQFYCLNDPFAQTAQRRETRGFIPQWEGIQGIWNWTYHPGSLLCLCPGIFCTILLMLWLCRGANYARKDRDTLLVFQRLWMKKQKARKRLTAEIKTHTILSVAAAWDSPCTGEGPTPNIKQSCLSSSPFHSLVGLQSALRDCYEEKGKPLPQMPQCKMVVGEETPETEEIGKDSATCTNWQIGKHNWENK